MSAVLFVSGHKTIMMMMMMMMMAMMMINSGNAVL